MTAIMTESAFETAALPHLDAVLQTARALTATSSEAESLVVAAYAEAYRVFTPSDDLRLALHRQVIALCPAGTGTPPPPPSDTFGAAVSAVGLEAVATDEAAITEAFRALPADLRLVLHLSWVTSFSYAEIGEITALPRDVVKARLYRARRELRVALIDHALRHGLLRRP